MLVIFALLSLAFFFLSFRPQRRNLIKKAPLTTLFLLLAKILDKTPRMCYNKLLINESALYLSTIGQLSL